MSETMGEYYAKVHEQRNLDRIKAHIAAESIARFQETELAEEYLYSEERQALEEIKARLYQISGMDPS